MRHRTMWWSVAGAHLLAAGATWYAGVPVATPFLLALAACLALALGVVGPVRDPHDDGPLGRPDPAHRGDGDATGAAPDRPVDAPHPR